MSLLERDPDLLRYVSAEDALHARRAVTAPLAVLAAGSFEPLDVLSTGSNGFGALILEGLVSREVTAGGQATLRLLGPGDFVHAGELEAGLLVADQVWTCSLPTQLAVLDDHFLRAVRHWPRLLTALAQRSFAHHDTTLIQLAISQQPRVEDRLVALFSTLAERWGRMTGDGVVVPLWLTHEALGRLIGARRPTVTLALKALSSDERLRRRDDGSWLLLDFEAGAAPVVDPLGALGRPALVELAPEAPRLAGAPENPFPRLREQARRLRTSNQLALRRAATLSQQSVQARAQTEELVAANRARRAAEAAGPPGPG